MQEDPDRALLRTRRLILLDGVLSRLMDSWTGGVFLAGIALLAGADNFQLGLIAALPFLAQVAQLPAVHILSTVTDRRRVVVTCALASRLFLAAIAILLMTGQAAAPPLLALLAINAILTVVATAAWNTWMRETLDPGSFGRFFGFRLQLATLIGALATLAGGWFLDRSPTSAGYGIVFLAGAAAGLSSVLVLAITPKAAAAPPTETQRRSALRQVQETLRAPGSLATVLGLGLTAAALSIALPFTAVYLLRSVGYSVLAVTVLALTSQVAYIGGLRVWGGASDRFGNRPVLQLAGGLLAVALLLWSIGWQGGPPALTFAYFAAAHILSGMAVGGLELTTGNLLLKTAPPHKVAAHLAAFSLARAAIAAAATIGAGWLWSILGSQPLAAVSLGATTVQVRGFHVLALLSTAAAALSVWALARVPEPQAASMPEVARAMRREVQAMSSVAGVRAFVHVTSFLTESLRHPQRTTKAKARKENGKPGPPH
ncbi:MAG: MFS transporter [Thermoplasmatota archaeon]